MTILQQRALTGFSFAAVMIAGIFGHYYSFLLLFGVITALSLWEFFGLVLADEPQKSTRKTIYTVVGILPYFATILAQNADFSTYETLNLIYKGLLINLLIAPTFIFILELFLKSSKPFEQIGYLCLSFFYITLPYSLLLKLAFAGSYHPVLVFGMLLCVWANDSFAYLVGSRIGKTKLFARISPGKTWEGSAGGVVGAAIAASLLFLVFPNELRLLDWIVIAVLASIFGTLGDLVESMLKRSLGVKDSGNLLPAHGGILDRFDAFQFLIIPVFIYFTYL